MDLEVMEKEVTSYVFNRTDITISEQARRIPLILDFMCNMYNKYTEEVTVEEAYKVLFEEMEVEQ